MKKEYLILIALILLSSAYLLFHKENKDNYILPEIKAVDVSGITALVLDKKEGQIKFIKTGKDWHMTDKKYLAEPSSVESMLDTLKTLKLSALVSQKGDLKRYELDQERQIKVQAMKGKDVVLEFTLGKTAPTANHTFVMLEKDKNVYHANGSFRSNFDKTVEDFRDKKVVEFKEASINQFTIEKDGLSKTFISKEEEKDAASITWSSEDGTPVDKELVTTLLSSLSFLECEKYLDAPTKSELEKEKPLAQIHLKNKETVALTIFPADAENQLTGISSMNPHGFVLSQFNGDEILSTIEKLLGITKAEDNKD